MPKAKTITEKSVNDYIKFLTDTAVLSRAKKINPRQSYCSDFLEKVKVVMEVDKNKEEQYTVKFTKAEYERYE